MFGKTKKEGIYSNLSIKGKDIIDEKRNLKNIQNATINKTLSVNQHIYTRNSTVRRNQTVGGDLSVSGGTEMTGNLTVNGDLNLTGNVAGNVNVNNNMKISGDLEVSGNILHNQINLTGNKILIGIGAIGYGINTNTTGVMTAWEEEDPTTYTGTSIFVGPFNQPLGSSIQVTEPNITAYINFEVVDYNETSGSLSFQFYGDAGTENWTSLYEETYLNQASFKTTGASPFTLTPKFRAGSNGYEGSVYIQGKVFLFKKI